MKQLTIGNVTLDNCYVLGPMAGVTDLPFRLLCREQGAGLLCMEMISAKGILYNNKNTESLMQILPEERPVSLQLFGSDADLMAEIAAQIEERPFDILDINMGCPVPKVVNNQEGSALMKNPKLVGEIVSKVSKAIKKPLTVKKNQRTVLCRSSRLGNYPTGKRGSFYSGHWKWRCRFTGTCKGIS